jgi:NAD(P) transhydrogenase subunit alpha
MIVGVPRETAPGERRVALVPDGVKSLAKAGYEVVIETGAGAAAGFGDEAYAAAGARLEPDRAALFAAADVLLAVRAPDADLARLRPGAVLVATLRPLDAPAACAELARRGVTALALELVPRITRAQSMDVLSSMATIAGYHAVLLAAGALPKIFPMLVTAAGTVAAARVLVIGAGVAGLQAIATARRLGAVVEAYDTRPAVKEQVQSLGARFVELPLDTKDAEGAGGYAKAQSEEFYAKQRALLQERIAASDVVITTAAVPGARAPVLIEAPAVQAMRPGSVIVDLAAEGGGNCALTKAGETVVAHGVTILGPVGVPSAHALHASQLFSKNVATLVLAFTKDGKLVLDTADEIARGALVAQGGEVVHEAVRAKLAAAQGGGA